MPLSLAAIFRLFILLALAAHVFFMYCLARTSGNEFGFTIGRFLLSAGFATVMLLPLSWAVAIAELPEMYTQHWRARHRWSHGRCSFCNYQRSEDGRIDTCPECGNRLGEPEPYKLDRRAIRRYANLVAIAWIVGIAGAEAWISIGEISFRRAAGAHAAPVYWRERGWPAKTMFLYDGTAFRTVNKVEFDPQRFRDWSDRPVASHTP